MGHSVVLVGSLNTGEDYITPDSLKDIDLSDQLQNRVTTFLDAYSWCQQNCAGKWNARSLYDYYDDFLNRTSFDFEDKSDAFKFKLCFGGKLRTY